MWSSPQKRTGRDGTAHHLVLLDTEGIDAYDQTAQYSTQIFSLAVLLSSLFVYNQMGGIDESALDRLSLVTEMTKHIRVRAGAEEGQELGEYAPAFLWLLRDFYLKLEEDGRKITAKDYLETALVAMPGSGPSIESKNAIRASIRSLFPDRDCATLVRPLTDENKLAVLDIVPREQLRPEFRQGVDSLLKVIFGKAQPKRFGTQVVTGPVLAGLVEAYVGAINNGAVPTISTAWQGVAESESRRAADAAELTYQQAFNQQVEAEEATLEAEHQRCLALARAVFADVAVGDERIKKTHEERLMTAINRLYSLVRGKRLAEAEAAVTDALYKASQAISAALRSNGTLDQFQALVVSTVDSYSRSAVGPTKWSRLADFLKGTCLEIFAMAKDLGKRAEEQASQRVDAVQRKLDEARATIATANANLAAANASIASQQQRSEQAERSARELGTAAQQQLRAVQVQLSEAQQQSMQRQQQLMLAQQQLSQTQQQLTQAQQQSAGLRVEKSAMESKASHIQGYVGHNASASDVELKRRVEEAEQRAANAEQKFKAKRSADFSELEEQLRVSKDALTTERTLKSCLQEDLSASEVRLNGLRAEAETLRRESESYSTRYCAERSAKAEAQAQCQQLQDAVSQARASEASHRSHVQSVQAQLAAAQATLTQLANDKATADARVADLYAEAVAARAQALNRAGVAAAAPAADDAEMREGSGSGLSEAEANAMTIPGIKVWLTEQGREGDVFRISGKKSTKKDWVAEAMRNLV
ncbi:MAG: hypothetical protein WDW38_003708 [Sanguina aurantia]